MTWPGPMLMLELSDLNVVGLLSKSFAMQYYGFFFANLLRFCLTICIQGFCDFMD